MKTNQTTNKTAGISDEAVAAKTGKTWAEWIAVLDSAGAGKMDHKQNQDEVERIRAFWSKALQSLKEALENSWTRRIYKTHDNIQNS